MLEKEGQGATCVLVAIAQSVVGAFAIKDPLKPEVRLPFLSMQSINGVIEVHIRVRCVMHCVMYCSAQTKRSHFLFFFKEGINGNEIWP